MGLFLESKFTVHTDNNPLAYIQNSRLGASQICWLSKLALFEFKIQYHLGKTNEAANALSQHPVKPEFEMKGNRNNNSEDPVMLSYATITDTIELVLKDTKVPYNIKKRSTGYK